MNAPVAAATRLRQPTAITLAHAPEGYGASSSPISCARWRATPRTARSR